MSPRQWFRRATEVAGHRAAEMRLREALERVTGAKDLPHAVSIARDALTVTTPSVQKEGK